MDIETVVSASITSLTTASS